MHQSCKFSIQCAYVFAQRSGRNLMSPLATASEASLMQGYLRNHCIEIRGSIGTPPRSE